MRNADLSPRLQDLLDKVREAQAAPGSLFAAEAAGAAEGLSRDYTDAESFMDAAQAGARVAAIHAALLIGDAAFRADYDAFKPKRWQDNAPIDFNVALQHTMGGKLLVLVKDKPETEVHFSIGYHAGPIADFMINDLHKRRIPFHIDVPDADFSRLLMNYAQEEGIRAFAAYRLELFKNVTNRVTVMPNSMPPSNVPYRTENHAKLFESLMKPYGAKTGSGEIVFTLTYFPTEIDAEIDGIPLPEYLKLHFEMSDQPEERISAAHGHLIARLDRTTTVRFTNDDGTDISMETVDEAGRHFTFCNSLALRNVPGSEVFSAPRRDSLNGVIVAKGKFNPKSDKSHVIENLTLHFKDGRLEQFSADKGAENFQAFLDRDDNNRYVGELGIGTNPHLKRHVINGLLVEKIGGSFHLALGAAYTMTNYLGTPVYVDNGNRSIDHWDITTMLYGCGGRMYLDGDVYMEDGVFLDPALDVLNRGWAAVPVAERPERWKEYKGPFTGEKA